ncbi:peroxisomal membrane protein 11B-like [Pollicipes pollicipes]|uniref:peroxisomal membrane protein 11B-like n=1 Tax=Pollicipes pollicipes TaxID=41117 RepID=UPI0018852102|nr:peroxisomal membrane protein 11B-like [Pollicipes pollicipes]XP_037082874.1 peroxisomal membrane protein 11B-like [Pollicipes pollicipes]XP_037082876.1 peroxisomal membrane protein 11B-like [Pollicipes pollicipes]XP_037082877.1 peroxisomal membrane protein 11B-like [Pollicipes pollicipes]XP_037082878.1 peroxisomal membrane protein 11B-like [Pollicipes pollicipes]
MDTWVKLNGSTVGKDKLLRVLQYTLKVVNHYIQRQDGGTGPINKWKELENNISSFRKLLRLGKSAEVLRGTARTLRLLDPVYRLTLTLGRIAQSLFLLADHLLWLSRARLVRINVRKWEQVYYRCWLYSVTMALCRDAYDLWRAAEGYAEHGLPFERRRLLPPVGGRPLLLLLDRHRDLAVDTLKNACEMVLPLAALGYLPLSPAAVGLCGVASSGLALWTVLDPRLVLRPS